MCVWYRVVDVAKILILGARLTTNRCQNNKLINKPGERVTRACRLWLQWDLFFCGRD